MPRFPGQPPGLDIDGPALLLGTMLEETTVAETLFLKVGTSDVDTGVVASPVGVVAGIGITVTVDGEEDGVSEGEAIVGSTTDVDFVSGVEATVASTAEVDVVCGVEAGTEGDAGVEGTAALSVTPVMTLKPEADAGKTSLTDGATSDVVPWAGVTVTVTIGFSVTVTISESHARLEPPGLPARPTATGELVGATLEPPMPPRPEDSTAELTAVTSPVLPKTEVVLPRL